MEKLKVKGTQKFMGKEIPVIEGGFGEGKKVICDKTIAKIHNQAEREIRRRITDNIKRFKENIDFVDLKKGVGESHTFDFLKKLGYAKQSITQTAHIYILSERGYAKLIKIMDTDLAWEIHDRLIDEYFTMREMISSNEQTKARLLLTIYNGGQDSVLASKKLTEIEVKAATRPLLEKIDTQNETIKEQENTISEQDKIITIQKPFVRAAIKLKDTKNTVSMEQAAKLLKYDGIDIGRNGLLKLLREHKVLMENNSPYQKYMNMGLFELKICIKETQHGSKMFTVTRVTGKGLIFLNQKIRQWFNMEDLDIEI